MSTTFIITKAPSVMVRHVWSMKDSMDGVLYTDIKDAIAESKRLGAAGVVSVPEMLMRKEIADAETGNDSED